MSNISQITSFLQNSFCSSYWRKISKKALFRASLTSSVDEEPLSFVKLIKDFIEQRSLFHFPNQCHLANEGINTLTPRDCNQKDAGFLFSRIVSQYVDPSSVKCLGLRAESNSFHVLEF